MQRLYVILFAGLLLGAGGLTTAAKAGTVAPQYNMEFFYHQFPGINGIKLVNLIFEFCQEHHIPCPPLSP